MSDPNPIRQKRFIRIQFGKKDDLSKEVRSVLEVGLKSHFQFILTAQKPILFRDRDITT